MSRVRLRTLGRGKVTGWRISTAKKQRKAETINNEDAADKSQMLFIILFLCFGFTFYFLYQLRQLRESLGKCLNVN